MRYLSRSAVLTAIIAVTLTAVPAHATPPVQVFAGGQAQPVFDAADVIREEVWVTAPVDSDRDGHDDLVHAVVTRPRATEQGLKAPVVYTISPYNAGTNRANRHDVNVELYQPGALAATDRTVRGRRLDVPTAPSQDEYFLARGFAVVRADSLGSGPSTGCPTTGASNETIGGKSVVDWLNGRASAKDAQGNAVQAGWTTGKVGMIGVSYNGTLPNAVASTGVEGLEAIVPIAAISSWYDYYRVGGAVVNPGGYQGEDADVLADVVYTRADREVCRPVIEEITRDQDRITGDYNRFWDQRNYLRDVRKVHAAVLVAHGLGDQNVRTGQAAQWYAALRAQGTPHKIWWHRAQHDDPIFLHPGEWLTALNRWFTRYLCGQQNGVELEPRATVQREDGSLSAEADWPHPAAVPVSLFPTSGGPATGGLGLAPVGNGVESLVDDSTQFSLTLSGMPASPNRLAYLTSPLDGAVRFSGAPLLATRLAFSTPAANVTALLIDRAPDGSTKVITKGWTDPRNRNGIEHSEAIVPGESYRISVPLQPHDHVFAPGHRIGLVLLSSDRAFTLHPKPGTEISVDLAETGLTVPVVDGKRAIDQALRTYKGLLGQS
ncbi:Xaa-Pro dipeptidyl-peptidase [Pseudonocardiaceae bacterium YIM PH 21723]|nr:Xaa-Pro dipeptidyl-peptidase [Pseudonocardiaceae bacterium YIM PH 21723]